MRFHLEKVRFAFLIPLGGLRATHIAYDDYFRLISKYAVDFLSVLI